VGKSKKKAFPNLETPLAYRTEFLNASIDAADHKALEIIEIK